MSDPETSFEIETPSGPVRTGLLLPAARPETFPCFADMHPLLSLDEIGRLISTQRDPRRRFDPKIWVRQQQNNGCNGFAAAGALGRALFKRGGRPIVLSGDFLYSQISGGRDQGSMLDEGMQSLMQIGCAPDELVPLGNYRQETISREANAAASRFQATECYRVDEELELLSGLALGFVGVVAVHVGRGGDYVAGPGNHSVCVDGLRIVGTQLKINSPGSWGLRMGTHGCWDLTWPEHLAESNRYHAFYLIRAAKDDPQGSNPPILV